MDVGAKYEGSHEFDDEAHAFPSGKCPLRRSLTIRRGIESKQVRTSRAVREGVPWANAEGAEAWLVSDPRPSALSRGSRAATGICLIFQSPAV